MKLMVFMAFVLAVTIASFTAGCVFVPTPHYYAMGSRENLTAQSTNLIQPGHDSIENVIFKLGEPDAISPDEHEITYGSKIIVGQLFILSPDSDGSELPDVLRYSFLNVTIGENGMVTNCAFSRYTTWDGHLRKSIGINGIDK